MIPKAAIVAWCRFAPWINDAQVEQDLIINRALVVFSEKKKGVKACFPTCAWDMLDSDSTRTVTDGLPDNKYKA